MADRQIGRITDGLQGTLDAAADERTREYWHRYLKFDSDPAGGQATRCRGVPMAGIRTAVRAVWRSEDLPSWPTARLLALAGHWLSQPYYEDKLAATLLIAELLAGRLSVTDAPTLAQPFQRGHIADWGTCDWYATKALHAFITADQRELQARAEAVAGWSTATASASASTGGLWQRRAAVVAFVKLAAQVPQPFPGFVDLLLDASANNLVSNERFAHTGPGWLLRELSRHHAERVARFVDEHPELSKEATRMATARLRPGPYRRR
jgi:3-methyladenine DNA glycosylase AlkD